jgi:hypothetical protein
VSNGEWYAAPHLALISKVLSEIGQGKGLRIIIECPPRHGKSQLCSVWLPTWFLNRWPKRRVILASYEADFAAEWGRAVRDTFSEYKLGTMSDDSTSAKKWNTEDGGGMQTAGLDGPITGKGANLLIIDDPVKNAEEARSKIIRDRNWRWWLTTARTRLEPGADVVVIMTRWHEDDLGGRLEKSKAEKFIVIRLPALAETGDIMGRKVGEPLWERRYNKKTLEQTRDVVGAYIWSALYQQSPLPEDGASRLWTLDQFEAIRVTELPQLCRVVIGVDPSGGGGDSQGIVAAGLAEDGRLVVLEDATVSLSPDGWGRAVVSCAKRWAADRIVCERNYGGDLVRSNVQVAMRDMKESFRVEDVTSTRGKHLRAEPVSAVYQPGRYGKSRAIHYGRMDELEQQLAGFTPFGWMGTGSPDRADALVFAATDLLGITLEASGEIQDDLAEWEEIQA